MSWWDTMKVQANRVYDWLAARQLNSVFWVVVFFCVMQSILYAISLFKPDFMGAAAWELLMGSGITVVISILAMVGIFWVLHNLESVKSVILPSREKAESVEDHLGSMPVHSWGDKEIRLFDSVSRTRAARIITVAIIYAITLYTFAPIG